MRYIDTSAFLKLLIAEVHSDELRAFLAAEAGSFLSSELLAVEAHRAARQFGLADGLSSTQPLSTVH